MFHLISAQSSCSVKGSNLPVKAAFQRWAALLVVMMGLVFGRESHAAFDISMTVDGSTVVDVGQFRGITISYSWASLTENLANAKIEVQLPSVLDTNSTSDVQLFGSAHTTSAVYDTATRKITFTFVNPLPAGSSGTVSFNTRFPTSAADGTLANIVATSSGTGQPNATDDVTLEANASLVTNLSMSKGANIHPMLGQNVSYSIQVSNTGSTDYLNPVIVDQLPAGAVLISALGGTHNSAANTVTWNSTTISPGDTRFFNLTVRYDGPAFSTGQWVTNSATGTGTDSLGAPVNLSASNDVQIVAPNPSAPFDKWDSNDPASLKGIFQYYFWARNSGNVPLSNYVFTDDLPKEFIPTFIYPGSDDTGQFTSTISVWYKTNTNSSWRLLPGSPFTTAPQTDTNVDLSAIGLNAGEVVSSVKYEFASLPVGYDANWRPRVYGTMGHAATGLDRDGAVIAVPKTVSNTYNVAYDYSGNTYTGSDTETTDIVGPSPMPSFTIFDPDPSSYIPLQEIKWSLRMENNWTASEPLINPVYATLLPANLEFVPGSVAVIEGPFALGQINTTVTDNYNGTGRQLVKFAFSGNHPIAWTTVGGINDDWAQYIDFRAKVKAGAAAGSFEVEYHLIGHGNTVVNPEYFQTDRTDTFDIDGDGNTTEKHGTSNGGDYTINTSTAIDSVLWVKGQLDAAFNRYPDAGFALPGGPVEYKLIVSNPGNIPLTSIRVMDILPHVGDVGVILHSQSRGSSFAPILASTVSAPAGITVKYSTATNPVRSDLDATLTSPAGAVSGSFSTTAPSPLSNTRSLLFDFGATVLNPAESKEITWTMNVPAGVTIGQVAWNSFGHRSQSAANGTALPPSEPVKVGTAVPITVGSFVWEDLDNDGAQDAGEPGISGATLQLFKSDGSPALDPLGNPVAPAASNSSGIYAFGALADGDYFIRVTAPGGVVPSAVQTADPDNDNDTDSNIDTSRSPPAGSYESGVFTFAVNTEPTVEPGAGGAQDDVDDNNGNMTIDFGFGGCAKNAIFVSNFFNGTIDAYDLNGSPLGVLIGHPGGGGYSGLGQYEVVQNAAGDFLFTGLTSHGVRKFANPSGADLGWMVAPGSGGLSGASDADFGPDGHLYVTSSTSPSSIKRYNGTTGAFIDTFVSGYDVLQSSVWHSGNLYSLAADGHLYRTAWSAGSGTAVDLGHLGFTGRGAAARGSKLYFNGNDGSVRSYDIGTSALAVHATPPAGFTGLPTGLDFDSDGNLYVSVYGGHNGTYDSFGRGAVWKAGPLGGAMTVLAQDPLASRAQPMPLSGSKDVFAVCWNAPAYDLSLITRLPSGQAASVLMGSTVSYEVLVKNQGQLGSGGFTVTARLPAGMSYVSASGTGFTCTESGGVVACVYTGAPQSFISSLAPGATAAITITGQLEAFPAASMPYRLWAEISSDFGNDIDNTPDTNTGSDTGAGTGTAPNDLVVNHNDINHTAQPGDEDDNDYEDIGVFPPPLSIGNLVWNDVNNNGAKDAGETGLSGVTVQLFSPGADNAIGGSGANADAQVGSNVISGVTGSYLFSGLSTGKYYVKVTPPAGYITSGTPDTADNMDDNDNNGSQPGGLGNPVFSPVVDLAVGTESTTDGDADANTNYTVDFGLWPGVAIGNLVWADTNNNGLKDAAETGISGLAVELLNQSGNTVLAATTTNAAGIYGFTVYTPGNYKVRVTPNATYPLASSAHATTDNGVDNNNDGDQPGNKSTPATSPVITLTAGGEPGSSGSTNNENTIDFGFRGCPTITNAPASLAGGNVGAPYSATVTASGGVAPYAYAITSGSLPSGLAFDTGTGLISGTTSVSGNHVITITATDSLGCTGATAITVPISSIPTYDYSDYSLYATASNFASTTLRIGPLVDADASSPANITASGDDTSNTDDEDGFVEPINLVPNVPGSTVVKVTNTTGSAAYLNAWIDFNRNGSLTDAGEQVAVNQLIANGRSNSNESISFTTPAAAQLGFNAIRVRLTSAISPGSTGATGMGEVEDYPVNICPTLGYAYGVQSGDLYQIDVATGTVSAAAELPSGFERSNGAAYAQDLGADGVVLFTSGTGALLLGAWDRSTGVTNVVGDFSSFGVSGTKIYSGDYFNGWYYFVVNNTDDLWKAKITGSSGNYTLVSASKVSDLWSNTRSHGYGDIVITPGGILYAHCYRDGGGPEFYTADLNQAVPAATHLGNPPYMHNGITFGLDGKLYGGLGVNANNADWFEVSLANGNSTYLRDGAVAGMSDMTMGACNPSQYLEVVDPWADKDFGDYYLFSSAASSAINTGIKMGSQVDAESVIANNQAATSDDIRNLDDEDGVTFSQLVQGQPATVTVSRTNTSPGNAYLNAWIDFDNDGLLTGTGEQVINNVLIPNGTNASAVYSFTIPANAYIGNVGSRFRITSTSNPGSVGASGSGEVEDHLANIEPSLSIGNLVWHDADNDGFKDASENGLAGASVQLFKTGADNLANTGDDIPVGSTLTTTATGAYSYTILGPAKYFVKVTPPAGYMASGAPATTDNNVDNNNDGSQPGGVGTALFSPVIDLTVNAEPINDGDIDPNTNFTIDFGLFPGIQLGNLAWHDADNDGVKDAAESGISGLLVELLNGVTDAVVATTATNASGQYGFTVYAAGSYKVRVTPNATYPLPSMSFTAADNGVDNDNNGDQPGVKGTPSTSSAFTLTPMGEPGPAGSSNVEHTIDFGFRPCPTISVTSAPSPLDIAVMRRPYSAQFNASGGMLPYTFTVASGSLPPGLTLSASGAISGIPTATGVYTSTIQASDVKTCTGQISGISIEVLPPLSIGNLVFLDSNSNGHHDSGEGVDGVTVQLYSSTQVPGTDTPLMVATSTGGGLYLFEGLLPGAYRVHVPAAMFASGAPLASTISIPEGFSGDDDVGEDGVNSLDPPATGISSGIVSLFVGTAPTDLNGETGANNTSDNDYDASINLTVDFGFANPVGAGNVVFLDGNGNGHHDSGEGVGDVDVELFRAGDNPASASPLAVTVTESDGHFLFDYLPAGNYFMRIPPSEFAPGGPLEGKVSVSGAGTAVADDGVDENGLDDPAPNINGIRTADFNLANNSEPTFFTGEWGFNFLEDFRDDNNYDLTIDFGFRAPNPNAVGVGNAVFFDSNGNGYFDGGEGVDGVTVKLFAAGVNPLSGSPAATTTTAGGGFYIFSELNAGSYFVFIPPQAFASGAPLHRMLSRPGQGGDFSFDDDQDENGDDPDDPSVSGVRSTDFDLAPNTEPDGTTGEYGQQSYADDTDDDNTDLTIDFAFHRPVGVGNLVFVDLNHDGGYDAGEGVDGVDVELYHDSQSPGFEPPLAATTTAGGGFYQFTGLEPGSYIVHIPTGEFLSGGTLEAFSPLSGQGADDGTDDYLDENGSDPALAWAEGVSSLIITLSSGGEPTDQTTELGQGKTSDNAAGDSDIDLTVDFGFFAGPPSSFSAWQASHPLGGMNGPADDPEGDGITNLAEYAFGLVPDTGVLPWCPFEVVQNAANGQIDAIVRLTDNLDDVVITLQGIQDLSTSPSGWFDITNIAPDESSANGFTTLAYRHLEQLLAFTAGSGIVRLKIELDADDDSVPESTAYSECWGWSRSTFGAYNQTFSNPYAKCPVFTGTVNSTSGSTLNLATAAGTESIVSKMAGGDQYYIEVLSGESEGQRFEVNETLSTAVTIVLDTTSLLNTLASPPATLAGDRIALRPHVTLAEMLPPAKFRATNSQGTADRVLYYTGSSFTSHWLFSNLGNPRWVTGAQLTNMNTRSMPPGEAVLVNPRSVPASIATLGIVRACKFACPLKQGANFIGGGWPMPQSPASRSMNVATGFKGATSASNADRVQLWNGDQTPGVSGYESHYLLKSGAIQRWVRVGDSSLADEMNLPLFKAMRGAYIISVNAFPGYVMPRPWTP